jgi:hypothetical protein
MLYSGIRSRMSLVIVAAVLFAAGNAILQRINLLLHLPFFLDSTFTAISSALFGIMPGVLTGALTNVFEDAGFGFNGLYWPWSICSIATALIVGYAVKSGRFNTILHAIVVLIAVTLANALLGAMIATIVYGGTSGAQIDYVVTGLIAIGQSVFSAALFSRIVVNLVDKALAIIPAFFLYRYLRTA